MAASNPTKEYFAAWQHMVFIYIKYSKSNLFKSSLPQLNSCEMSSW